MMPVPLAQNLLKTALLGTERQTQPPTVAGDLAPYFAELYPNGQVPAGDAREAAFLGAWVLTQHYQAVGRLAGLVGSGSMDLPAADTQPLNALIPAAAELHLRRLLNDNALRPLLDEWLVTVAARGWQVPPLFVPALLELARQNKALRPLISAVVGARGQWLAQQNPAWQALLHLQATGEQLPEAVVWDEGNTAQRVDYLRLLRAQNAAQGLALLQTVWKQEAANVRQALLESLQTGLSAADEPWLESCLDDRSKGVGQLAARLLGGLPGSAFSQRQQDKLQQWLQLQSKGGLLNRLSGKQALRVNLPEVWDKQWARDGIEEKPPGGKGEKAWWLEQTMARVPPAFWVQHWPLDAEHILALAKGNDWEDSLLLGWRQALEQYPDHAWATAWLRQVGQGYPAFWNQLPATEAEQLLLEVLEAKRTADDLLIVDHLQHAWSADFSRQVLKLWGQRLGTGQRNLYALNALFRSAASRLDPGCLAHFERDLQTLLADDTQPLQRGLQDALFSLRFRADLRAALDN